MCGKEGSSSGRKDEGAGSTDGVFDHQVSSQKTSRLHARGSKLEFEDNSEDNIATETCLILSAFFHITTHALSDTE